MNRAFLRTVVHQCLLEALEETSQPVRLAMEIAIPDDLKGIAELFKRARKDFYLVGGAVRDALLGKAPKDYDVATNAVPTEVERILRQGQSLTILPIGKAFGVVAVVTPEKNTYEVATFRQDIGKGRRPDSVAYTTIDQDVRRRDLTINALFYDINKKEVVDYVGGIEDIKNNVVRTVGDAHDRFDEDRLRIVRALRFAGIMNAEIDPATAQAIRDDNSLAGVSPERIRDEFLKGISSARNIPNFLKMFDEFDLWPQVFPGLTVNTNYVNTKNVPVQLACLLRDNDPRESLPSKLNKLKYSAVEATQVSFLVAFQKLSIENAWNMNKVYKNAKLESKDLEEFAELTGQPDTALVKAFIGYEPTTTGAELQARGFKGRDIGTEMERLETERFRSLVS